jgi:hypothetical protein
MDVNVWGRSVEQRVPLLWTPCTFGGARPWFGCPRCAKRVAIVYFRDGRIRKRERARLE